MRLPGTLPHDCPRVYRRTLGRYTDDGLAIGTGSYATRRGYGSRAPREAQRRAGVVQGRQLESNFARIAPRKLPRQTLARVTRSEIKIKPGPIDSRQTSLYDSGMERTRPTSKARQRILETADRLFYEVGFRAVG